MALIRSQYSQDSFNLSTGAWTQRVVRYDASKGTVKGSLSATVLAADVPPSPTEAQINAVADPLAMIAYTAWLASVVNDFIQGATSTVATIVP